MKEIVEKAIQEIDSEIKNIDIYGSDIINNSLRMVKLILTALTRIRERVIDYIFPSVEEEILFFKVLKPELLCRLLYFNEIFTIESKCPNGSIDVISKYLNEELDSLTSYFNKHLTFYEYYRTGSTIHDELYFVRGNVDIRMCTDSLRLFVDKKFSTVYDYNVAKILTNEKLRIYLNRKLLIIKQQAECEINSVTDNTPKTSCQWTGKKNALIEIGYAFYCSRDINHGNIDIKEIMDCLGTVFNVDLGDYYRTYLTLKDRKKDRTQYLNLLTNKLLNRMNDDDELE